MTQSADSAIDTAVSNTRDARNGRRDLRSLVGRFAAPSLIRSLGQLATSIGLFLAGCAAMYWANSLSYWLTLLLALPTAGLLVRVFIIQHDCGHGALFRERWANSTVGIVCSLFTLTPYTLWRRHHAAHHGNWNNLDRRNSGSDIYSSCSTVAEYRAFHPWQRLLFRLSRHPLVANVLLPPFIFLLLYRVPFDTPRDWWRERRELYATNLAIGAVVVAAGLLLGFGQVLKVQLPVIAMASIIGVWLFTLQHRFDGARWARQGNWEFTQAALESTSYLRLPKVLQWFTGNIGFHHIHHLDPRVPNYRLQECHKAVAGAGATRTLTLGSSLRALRLVLWDEERGRLVRLGDAAVTRQRARPGGY